MGDKTHSEVTVFKARRVRKRIRGSAARPRLCVHKSLKHLSAQIVDDDAGRVLLGVSTRSKEFSAALKGKKNIQAAKALGILLAERARARNIAAVAFDRSGYIYHGKLAALADGAREGGLKF
ncbi:50S ribosomal protein L18 [bacterium]|nr:50S ribosomal protein L18 [bacterium]